MDSATFEAIHKYGAALSLIGCAIAVLAYATIGSNTVVGLFFGWAGPLGVFYFGGAYLSVSSSYWIVGEELLRGVAWYFGSLVAWSFVVTTNALPATSVTVFALPAFTALGIILVMIATRYRTGSELKVETESGQLLVQIVGAIAFGFVALYLVLDGHAGWWLFGLYLLSIPVGLALYLGVRGRYPRVYDLD